MVTKAFTLNWSFIGLAAPVQSIYRLNNPNREMKIVGLHWDAYLFDSVTSLPVPLYDNNRVYFTINLYKTSELIAQPAEYVSGTAAQFNANQIIFNTPGSYSFECFYIKNSLLIECNATNYSVNNHNLRIQLILEIEEKIEFQTTGQTVNVENVFKP